MWTFKFIAQIFLEVTRKNLVIDMWLKGLHFVHNSSHTFMSSSDFFRACKIKKIAECRHVSIVKIFSFPVTSSECEWISRIFGINWNFIISNFMTYHKQLMAITSLTLILHNKVNSLFFNSLFSNGVTNAQLIVNILYSERNANYLFI